MTTDPPDARVIDLARAVAVDAAEAAGRLLRSRIGGAVTVTAKGLAGDVVTDLDIEAERIILGRLRAAFPSHRIQAEEGGSAGATDGRWQWSVDPLDGTNNVVIGLPAYVVGVGLCVDGVPVLGVVHEPATGRTCWAVHGGGVHGAAGPRYARPPGAPPVLAWTQGYRVGRGDPRARMLRLGLETTSQRVLQLWAPLLCWAMLVRGDIDGIVGYCAEAVDLVPGVVLAVEAGMTIRTLDGGRFDDDFTGPDRARSFVAGPAPVVRRLVRVLDAVAAVPPAAGLRALDAAVGVADDDGHGLPTGHRPA